MAHKNKTNFSPYKQKNQGKLQVRSRGHLKPEKIFDLDEANDRLYDIFKNHDFSHISHEERLQMARYYQLLMQAQEKQNLTRLMQFRDIAIKQFIDSAIVRDLYPLEFPLLDLGTGPGLPGIILKILFPNENVFLAEGVQKRVNFLKEVREDLQLKNLGIFGRNIDENFVYPVRGVITRAVEDISNTLENVKHCLQTNGKVFFMKGPNVGIELDDAIEKHKDFYKLEKDVEYSLPKTTHLRRLVVFKKIRPHPLFDMEDFMDREYRGDDE